MFSFRLMASLGFNGFLARCGGVLAQGEGGFGLGWDFSWMGWRFS